VALPQKLGRRLLLGLLAGVAVYAGIAIWADGRKVAETLLALPLWVLPAACALSFLNYVIRFAKWQRYCKLLDIQLETGTSFLIYLSGMTLSVTPGKMGEVFKSWLVRQVTASASTTRRRSSSPSASPTAGYLILVAIGGLNTAPEYAWVFWSMLAVCDRAGAGRIERFCALDGRGRRARAGRQSARAACRRSAAEHAHPACAA
jgi:hypothetical protein